MSHISLASTFTELLVKAPTRKEQLETRKTMARIKAEQTVTLARETKPLSTSALFLKYRYVLNEQLALTC